MAAIKYPPCDQGCDCTGNGCKQPGDPTPYEWPELIELMINIYLGINETILKNTLKTFIFLGYSLHFMLKLKY
ncbi:hypothetical protein H5410_043587 [Solanum commersonii]|uniref:Uncharacterized protein n=1 Tax=Solanum commersonii TaxID=4109 RepID=A0A9J5XY00_SOLCO|nr:hypothetical protein H5410_043587 [Solanum commersonii]